MRIPAGCIAIFCVVSALSPAFAGGDVEKGRLKASQCVSCHGPGGWTNNPTFPHLAGQNAGYLMDQLHHFKEGTRFNPMMTPIAKSLSKEDMQDLAAYYSTRIGGATREDEESDGAPQY